MNPVIKYKRFVLKRSNSTMAGNCAAGVLAVVAIVYIPRSATVAPLLIRRGTNMGLANEFANTVTTPSYTLALKPLEVVFRILSSVNNLPVGRAMLTNKL
jgi:hypothetical protein